MDSSGTFRSTSKSKLTRSLLASTCLTVACGAAAQAGTITEGTTPAPADFPNTSNGFLLPVGTTQVLGTIGPFNEGGGTDLMDWFEFQGLGVGDSFTLRGFNTTHSEGTLQLSLFTTGGVQIGSTVPLEFNGTVSRDIVNGVVPGNGDVVAEVFRNSAGGLEGAASAGYNVVLTDTSSVPEPATLTGVGFGLAGLLAWRRRRSQ